MNFAESKSGLVVPVHEPTTEECQTARQAERDAWDARHRRCPDCGSDAIMRTTMMTLEVPGNEPAEDTNYASCGCGFHGKCKELVP